MSNSTSVGGILSLDPNVVDMQDGKFELMLVRPPKDAGELISLVSALTSQRYVSPMLTFKTVRRLTVRTETQIDWTLDGEHAAGQPTIDIENLHHAITLVRGGK